jgi:hypothetical protein
VSRYIQVLNSIKENISNIQLTPSQQECLQIIEGRLSFPGVVNVYGLHGVGKTVMGWAMNSAKKVNYIIHPTLLFSEIRTENKIIFIDNGPSDHSSFRKLMAKLESCRIDKAVIVSNKPIEDYVFRFELHLSDDDILIAKKNIEFLGYKVTDKSWNNLWHGLIEIALEEK